MANGTIPFLANLDLNLNEVRNAKMEVLSADPTGSGLVAGRLWYNSVSKALKFYDGTSVVTLAGGTYIPSSAKGAAAGVCPLNASTKIDSTYLPSYVDDVIEAYIVSGATALSSGWLSLTDGGAALTPETGKIYVVLSSGSYQNKTYRWGGSTYAEISPSVIYSAGNGLNLNSGTFSVKIASSGASGLSVDSDGVKLAEATTSAAGAMSATDKTKLDGLSNPKTYSETNPALTASGGVCTWTCTHNLSTTKVIVQVYDVSSGSQVVADVAVSTNYVTISIVSAANISAGTYRAVVMGF